jgi:phosphatidylglycerophosphate synthase
VDAVVLADSDLARVRIAGLAVRDRAARIASRLGARRVLVVEGDRDEIARWRAGHDDPLLVIRADQLVHTPLVAPLVEALDTGRVSGLAIAVGPDGAYAGAFVASGAAASAAADALARGEPDTQVAAAAQTRIPHGEIARHPIATAADRAGAHRLLWRILIKPQDNVITRYLFRPVSLRLSKVLVWTPITATQVSCFVALLVAIGCWLTTYPSTNKMIAGALIILGSSYFDCCDGEIARVKLQASRTGAWIDTIVDELSSIAYMLAIGWHCHLMFGRDYLGDLGFDPWLVAMAIGAITYAFMLFGVYYNIIVAVGSANSQDYISRFRIVPGSAPRSVRLVAVPAATARELPRWLTPIVAFLPNVVRRDFIVWLAAALALLRVPQISFGIHVLGGVVSSIVIGIDHVHLRRVRGSVRRAGQILEVVRR